MEKKQKPVITVVAEVNAPVQKVWNYWNDPNHIVQWNAASDDWHTPKATVDLTVGGKIYSRMESKDGNMGFDFEGIYTEIIPFEKIAYVMPDQRKVQVIFEPQSGQTRITEHFDAEGENPPEMQQQGWQSILNHFKNYVEELEQNSILQFEILINAPAAKVYQTMLHQKHYTTWTAAFNSTSRFKGSWEQGAKILFVGTDKNGKEGGMVSRINTNIPNRLIVIEHMGLYIEGEEILSGPEVDVWAGAIESYWFKETNGKTLLTVYLTKINEEFKKHFEGMWPNALKTLKELCETNTLNN
ncbi:MAG: SRPBCC family protein [Salinivirgaceae bacterium]